MIITFYISIMENNRYCIQFCKNNKTSISPTADYLLQGIQQRLRILKDVTKIMSLTLRLLAKLNPRTFGAKIALKMLPASFSRN